MANYTAGLAPEARPSRATAPVFTAVVRAIGVNFAVDVPEEVSAWFGERGNVPVLGLLDGVGIRSTLTPQGGGRHRLYLNAAVRRAADVGAGDEVRLRLWRDESARRPQLPADVREALRSAGVWEAFAGLPPSHRREFLVWIEDAKRPETRRRRIGRAVTELRRRQGS